MRFPEFEGEWEIKKLSEVAEIGRGKSKHRPRDAEFLFGGTYPFIQTGDIRKANLYLTGFSQTYSEAGLRQSKLWNENTLCITIAANIAETAILKIKACFPDSIIGLIPKEDQTIVLFVKHLFDKFKIQIQSLSQGAAQDNLNQEKLSKIEFSFPSIVEQVKISSFLSCIDDQIQTQNKILLHYQSLIQNLRDKIFKQKLRFKDEYGKTFPNWQMKKLNDVAKIFDGTHQTPIYVENGVPFYSVENVTANNFNDTKFISKEVFQKENKRVKLEKGDILMTRIGDIGTVRFIDWDVRASFYVSLALIKQSDLYNSEFMAHYFLSKNFQKELWNRTIHVAFPIKINLREIGECIVLLPHIEEQKRIARFLSSIVEKIEAEKEILEYYENQKKYLLQNLFI